MKNFGAAILLLFGVLLAKEKAFVVVIPSYNNAQVYRKNLDSVFAQNYSQYRVIYIDDASSDGTGEKVKAYVQEKRQEKRVSIILNQTRLGALANKYKGAWLCDPKEIVVDLDGDDWFAHPNVLARLNEVYSDPEVWVTYGQFVYYPCKTPGWAAQVPDEIIAKNAFREYNWVTTALRTFYAGLFQKIRKEDLLFDGDFFPMAGDLAFMFPIVEMAGVHSRFISEALYVYNVSTGINDIVRNPEEQKRLGWVIQNLDSIFDQKYKNFRVIYIDDASTDGTAELVEAYVRQRGARERFTLIRNKEKQGPLACTCGAVFLCGKEEIVVDLDGNDWLAHEGVLSCLNELYQDPDVWMTYGQFLRYPRYTRGSAFEVPEEVIEENRFRSFGGAVTHLKTFYAALFQEVDKGDFLFEGKFIEKAGDMAYALPLLEMAGRRICFVPEVLYVYNEAQPLNEHKVPDDLEAAMDRYIRSKKPYLPLDELPRQKLEPIYTQIEDLFHPTLHDYQFIQDYLSFGRREKLDLLGDMEARMRALKIIGKRPEEFPKSGTIAVNSTIEKKENCLLVYSTFNERYPKGLERLIEDVRHSDFKGHILFRLGGWPDSEGGSLALSHVPYGFKVSFFNEARRLGYKRALWLDAAVVPLVSLNEIFRAVEERGLFVMGNSHAIGPYLNAQSAAFFGLNLSSTYRIPSCSAGLFGIDFTQPIGKRVFDWWRSAAFDKDAFFSVRSDQSALSAILYQCGVADFVDLDKMPHSADAIRPDSLFWLDREFVH